MRLVIVGGYLGSGKTTWLRHQLHAGTYGTPWVLVNEAAETPVDDALLSRAAGVSVLAGGCVCCTARDDLIAELRRLCDLRSRTLSTDRRIDTIVLETSGLADPGPIIEAIRSDAMLAHHILLAETIVIVDALHAALQLLNEPLGRAQIEVADNLVLTKVDVAEPAGLGRLIATLRQLNPDAKLSAAVLGETVPLPSHDPDSLPLKLPDPSAQDNRPPLAPVRLKLDNDTDWTAFAVWLSALLHARGNDIVRVKGVVRTPAGRLLLQAVRKVVQPPEILPEQAETGGREDGTIVVIGRGYEAADLQNSLRRFTHPTRR